MHLRASNNEVPNEISDLYLGSFLCQSVFVDASLIYFPTSVHEDAPDYSRVFDNGSPEDSLQSFELGDPNPILVSSCFCCLLSRPLCVFSLASSLHAIAIVKPRGLDGTQILWWPELPSPVPDMLSDSVQSPDCIMSCSIVQVYGLNRFHCKMDQMEINCNSHASHTLYSPAWFIWQRSLAQMCIISTDISHMASSTHPLQTSVVLFSNSSSAAYMR